MPTATPSTKPDPADALQQTAQNFYDTADKLRLTTVGMPDDQAGPILDKAQELTEGGNAFTAEAMQTILAAIASDLAKIQATTKQACDEVNHLKTVDQIISIATLMVAVGVAAADADPAAIIASVEALGDGLAGNTSTIPSASSDRGPGPGH